MESQRSQVSPDLFADEEGEAALREMEAEEAVIELERRGAPSAVPYSHDIRSPVATGCPVATGEGCQKNQTVCVECQRAEGQQKMRAAFGINVCYECQKVRKVHRPGSPGREI